MLEQQDTASVERPREPARDDDHEADHARVREELEQVARLAVVAARHHDVSAVWEVLPSKAVAWRDHQPQLGAEGASTSSFGNRL